MGNPLANGQLLHLLTARAESKNPLRVGLIGAGKFGTMFLTQARRVAGLHVLGVVLSLHRAREALTRAEWPPICRNPLRSRSHVQHSAYRLGSQSQAETQNRRGATHTPIRR